jgi:Ca2+/Na+ antiporter
LKKFDIFYREMKKHKKIILAALTFPLSLLIVSFLIGRNLFVEEWKEVIVCLVLYVGVVFLIYRRKETTRQA